MVKLPDRCPNNDWRQEGVFCYWTSCESASFDNASAVCESFGAFLSSILNSEEENLVGQVIIDACGSMSMEGDWIGLRLDEDIVGKSCDF
jgi:hypothetical protein